MAYPDAEILWLDETGMRPVPYTDTEHYLITRRFLENPNKMLNILLSGE